MSTSRADSSVGAVLSCPCAEFDSLPSIRTALMDSPEQIRRLEAWLAGTTSASERAAAPRQENYPRLSCGSHCYCRKRVRASFAILNGIRDACRPFLESGAGAQQLHQQQSFTPKKKKEPSYDEAFPSLGAAGGAAKRNAAANKPKRRIRPALVTQTKASSAAGAAPPWNLVNLPNSNDDDFPAIVGGRPLPAKFKNKSGTQSVNASASASAAAAADTITITPKKKKKAVLTPTTPVASTISSSSSSAAAAATASPQQKTPTRTVPNAETSPTKNTKTLEAIVNKGEMKRLVDVYSVLIHSCLVPSSALELHLLIRLLTASKRPDGGDVDATTTTTTTTTPFASIFSSPDACIAFAVAALRKLSTLLIGLGPILFKDLVRCPPFRQHLPDLTEKFTALLQEYGASQHNYNLHHHGGSFVSISVDQTAFFTLPFKEERDSRQNFTTREAQAAYKNREETRDAFLYQLRAFLHARGALVDTTQANRAIQKVRQSSRLVVQALLDANQPWFAEFFCEMLLQIGNVPIQETDQELLKIMNSDKDKLQKLHRRFSTKTSRTDRSTKALDFEMNGKSVASSPEAAAQQLFPHHQEFFYLFLFSADSYNFSMHLRARLVTLLSQRRASTALSAPDVRKKVLDLRLLAKFLGVLLFSPNWRSSRDAAAVYDRSLDGLEQLERASDLSIVKCIHDAIYDTNNSNRLVVTIPWVVELLKPSQWDAQAGQSKVYSKILSTLRRLELDSFQEESGSTGNSPIVKALLGQHLELLFSETVGLSQTMKLIPSSLVLNRDKPVASPLAEDSIIHCATLLCASHPQLDELTALVSNLAKKDSMSLRSPGASRKLRPSVVSPTITSLQTPTISPSPNSSNASPFSDISPNPSGLSDTRLSSFRSKLRDAFFHQHGDLKTLCEFATNQALKNVGSQLVKKKIQPLLREKFSNDDQISDTQNSAVKSCLSFLRSSLQDQISGTVVALGPPNLDAAVKDIAVALAVAHGEQAGKEMVYTLVDNEMKKASASLMRENKKRLFVNEPVSKSSQQNSSPDDDDNVEDAFAVCTLLMREASSVLNSIAEQADEALASLHSLNSKLEQMGASADCSIPPEKILRPFFEAILSLDDLSASVIEWSLAESGAASACRRWEIISTYLGTAVGLARLSRYGLRKLCQVFSDETVLRRILRLGANTANAQIVSPVFANLVHARLIKGSVLKNALRDENLQEILKDLTI